ncbi:MAG: GNAT family N-acetyltransferase [Acidimicrobiia bacterium]|nr:GNAT family N-acetyltransferase [Acidimicrobiia bacterium]
MPSAYDIKPVTPDRHDDLLTLFEPNGAYSNCWCTWWLLTNREWNDTGAEGRRELIEQMVVNGEVPGLLAYAEATVVGWVSVGPRERYARMMSPRSKIFRPLDDAPSWMINCFLVHKKWRGKGVATALLQGAVDYARSRGATRIEGYPKDTSLKKIPNAELFVGSLQMFLDAGFTEAARVGNRPLLRLEG